MLDAEEQVLRGILGDLVFGVDDENMEAVVVRLLHERRLSLAAAESVTGGLVTARLTTVRHSSEVFRGGVIAYQPQVKYDLLGVAHGPVVTAEAAVTMAEGVAKLLGADVGLATTGVAGPDPLEGIEPGTVFVAVALPDGSHSAMVRLPGDRERVRQYSTISLLDLLRRRLLALP
ncbi:MAG: nicotinamide-nucleotide amidohydrolase family protein [Acidimicrobiales bacterium]